MNFRVSAIRFNGISLNSVVATWANDGPNKKVANTYTFVGIGKPTGETIKKGDSGTLEFELEGKGGSGTCLLSNVEFFERDEKDVLNFYVTERSSPTVCA